MTTINRKQSPHITHTADLDLHLKPCTRITLDNGVEAFLVNAGAQDVMQMELVFDAGNWYEPQNMVAAATNYLLKSGTSTMKAFDINEAFEYYGAYLNRSSYAEHAHLSLHTLSKHAGELLPVVLQLMQDSILPESELALMQQNNKQRLQVNLKKCDFVAGRLIDTYSYGSAHPYGRFSSAADYDALERSSCVDFYNRYYKNGSFKIFTSGKLPGNIEQLLNTHFGQHPVTRYHTSQVQHPLQPATEKHYRISNDPNGVQGAIRMARPFEGGRKNPDFMACMVLNNIFGGFFGSRLMGNIREDKGYTYGIHSYMQNHINAMAWMVSTEAGRDVCEPAIEEVYKEMDLLKTELVDDEELLLVRNYMMGQLLGDLDGPFQLMSRWKTYVLNGLDASYFDRYVQTIKTITAEDIQALAKKYLNKEDFYELVVV